MKILAEFVDPDCNQTLAQQKSFLRKQLLSQRLRLVKQNHAEYSVKIQKIISSYQDKMEGKKFFISSFFPLSGEPNCTLLAEPDWLLPYANSNDGLKWFLFGDGVTGYSRQNLGLWQKDENEAFLYEENFPPLLCLTPGLAGSQNGDRLGYGKGYFDTFFSKFINKVHRVLCLPNEDFLFDRLPTEPHDIKMDEIIY